MKIGDLVTRKKHNNDIVFVIVDIINTRYILKGKSLRLMADSDQEDLVLFTNQNSDEDEEEEKSLNCTRAISQYLRGKILHIDGDESYLNKSMKMYEKFNVPAVGYNIKESEIKDKIVGLLTQHNPDILVITGHDSFKNKNNIYDVESYINSKHYIAAVKSARIYQPNKDSLIIFAGACQSFYEGLIESGANFASSPERSNIHALDPVGIAIQVSNTNIKEYVNIEEVLRNTVSEGNGLGGIETKGIARQLYLGSKK